MSLIVDLLYLTNLHGAPHTTNAQKHFMLDIKRINIHHS